MKMRPRLGGVIALFSAATLFAVVTLCVKLASRYYSGLTISSVRFAVGVVLCSALILRKYPGLKVEKPSMVLLRGLFGAGSMITSYAAISLTGPGRAALLGNTYPLFVAVFGALFFGERLKPRTLASIAVCTAGAVLVMRDGGGSKLGGDLLALANAVLAGLAVNCLRRASAAGDNPFLLYLSPCLFGLGLAFFTPAPGPVAGPIGPILLIAVGAGSFLAQVIMSVGYRSVPASSGSVVFYWETALTVILGVLFGGEVMSLRFGSGCVVIIAGLWLNHGKASAPSSPPPAPMPAPPSDPRR
jgi:drug/metabolite transporter (DMT)-like permease